MRPEEVRRRGGPQVIFFGGDDEREEWTWECRFPHQEAMTAFNDAPTWAEAAAQLREHHRQHHGPRGRHACPRCGNPVQNRTGDPERTDLCPPCTAALFQPQVDSLQESIDAVINLADQWEVAQRENRAALERGSLAPEHTPDPQDFRLAATGCLEVPAVEPPLHRRRMGVGTDPFVEAAFGMFLKRPQDAAQAPQDGANGGDVGSGRGEGENGAPECPCAACDPGTSLGGMRFASRMSVCPDCGNKRCPKAAWHGRGCSKENGMREGA